MTCVTIQRLIFLKFYPVGLLLAHKFHIPSYKICSASAASVVQSKCTKHVCMLENIACEKARLWVMRLSGGEQSDPAWRSLVKRWQESESLTRLAVRFRARAYAVCACTPKWACSQAGQYKAFWLVKVKSAILYDQGIDSLHTAAEPAVHAAIKN